MNKSTRAGLLIAAAVAVAWMAVQMKRQEPANAPPPAALSGGEGQAGGQADHSVTHRPTILHARPLTPHDPATSPQYQSWPEASDGVGTDTGFPDSPALSPRLYDTPPESPPEASPAASAVQSPVTPGDPPPSPPATSPPAAGPPEYVTRADDSFWTISQQRYGDGSYYKALFVHNRARVARPDQLPAGIAIETPRVADLQRWYPELCPTDAPQPISQ